MVPLNVIKIYLDWINKLNYIYKRNRIFLDTYTFIIFKWLILRNFQMFWFFFKREIIKIMEIKEKWWNSKTIFFAYRKIFKKVRV